jgi:murein DD-endopeptidase MepM/ murein hydrolase activator NlpD
MAWVPTFRRPERAALLLALALGGAGCATLRAPALPPPEGPAGAWYLVEPGDSLASIAARHGVPVVDLAEINGLKRGDSLTPGRMIFLLAADRPPPPRGAPPPSEAAPALASGTSSPAPLRWPLVAPQLSSTFGARQGRAHEGIDLAAPLGTPIYAAEAGQVLYAGDAVRGYGNMVVLEHPGGLLTVYAHTSVLLVRTGDRAAIGQEIARVGQSGRATAPHLHFEVRRGQVPQDPLRFLPPAPLASAGEKQ